MKNLTDDNEVLVDNEPDASDEVANIMRQYNRPMQVDPDPVEQPSESKQEQPVPSAGPVAESVWRSRPDLYFQRGEKKGQLRPNAKNPEPKKEMEISGTLIDGALFIMLVDMLFPLAIVAVNNNVTRYKITAEQLQLTEKQKKDLAPIADEVTKRLSMKADPMWLMVVAMAGIYGINYMAAREKAKSDYEIERRKDAKKTTSET